MTGRRRYVCVHCRRTGWQRRLSRRTITVRTAAERREMRAREFAFSALVMLALLTGAIFAIQACERLPGDPEPPPGSAKPAPPMQGEFEPYLPPVR